MNKEFIPYEQALALKELGFDEPCFGYYEPNGELDYIENHILKDFPYLAKNSEWQDLVAAPLYQQAFRWFRDKFNLKPQLTTSWGEWDFYIPESEYNDIPIRESSDTWTYEDAELACLIKLIEIVKKD
jgi:hypothetical protein